jgi:hydrogenase-4 component B
VRTYLLVSHVSLMCLLIGVLPIAVEHSTLDLDELRQAGGSPFPVVTFWLVLLGLSVRAGVTPFHFWVPTVHPQLPTNTHAMMSAVMLKIPVYLMIRFFFEDIIGPVQWWWGAILVVLAGVTAVVTVFYALVSTDLKIALAYHSVENIGIILVGLGMALLFSDERFAQLPSIRAAAGLALLAGLYHVVNHALFKSLLFLGAGSIERHVGVVDLRRLGGLIRTLPWTAIPFLAGATAIADLPPLNGFISSWLTLQSMFAGQESYRTSPPVPLVIMVALVIGIVTLALAFAATTLAFVKIAGEALLGESREGRTPTAEARSMRGVMVVLAAICLLLGIQPWLLVPWLSAALRPIGYDLGGLTATPTVLAIETPPIAGSQPYSASLPVIPLVLLVVVPVLLTLLLRARRWVSRPVWVGGVTFRPETMQYTGSALSALLWEPVSRRDLAADPAADPVSLNAPPGASGVPVGAGHSPFRAELPVSHRRTLLEVASLVYNKVVRRTLAASEWFGSRLQGGDVRGYLLYILATVILVLAVLAVVR